MRPSGMHTPTGLMSRISERPFEGIPPHYAAVGFKVMDVVSSAVLQFSLWVGWIAAGVVILCLWLLEIAVGLAFSFAGVALVVWGVYKLLT